jgi:hypothetical protein
MSVFFIVFSFSDDGHGAVDLVFGVGFAIGALWLGLFCVFEWTLRADGMLETRALLRRRVETVSRLVHDKDADEDRWLVTRAGAPHRMRLSAKSGDALATALRARAASELIYDPTPPAPSSWWSRVLDWLPD